MKQKINKNFWCSKKVLITGHTGFKGSWLCIMLNQLGAKVYGYALEPPTIPSLFELCKIGNTVNSVFGDIRDREKLSKYINEVCPEIVIHMAAQPLVRESYKNPVETYEINVMGTVNVLEAVRSCESIKAVVNVTTDKCYENKEWYWGYRENEPLGGYDPYSNSKACSELVTSAFRNSYFNSLDYSRHGVALASVRAGNVIGGGDWAKDRLIPDCIQAILEEREILIRNPYAIRPWQHVLEPLCGYLILAEKLYTYGSEFASSWNFGSEESDARTVKYIVEKMCSLWGHNASYTIDNNINPYESHYLKLDCSKAKNKLHWYPRWNLDTAIAKTIEWIKVYKNKGDVLGECKKQIQDYINDFY